VAISAVVARGYGNGTFSGSIAGVVGRGFVHVAQLAVNATFATDLDGFNAGTRVAAEGEDYATGYLSIGPGVTATKSFSAVSSGVFRTEFFYKVPHTGASTIASALADTVIYFLPTAGAVSLANSITTFTISREEAKSSVDNRFYSLRHHSSAGDAEVSTLADWRVCETGWIKISFVANFADQTYDIYINNVLWERQFTWANAAAADFSRIVIVSGASAPATLLDTITVERDWALPVETLLVEDDFTLSPGEEIEDTTPVTDNRGLNPQPWSIPAQVSGTYGSFTRTVNGLQGDTAKSNVHALYRCGPEGIFEADWTSASTGNIYIGLVIRLWASAAAKLTLRYRSNATAGNELALFLSTQGASQTLAESDGTAGGVTWAANTPYTLKMEARGRFIWCYVNDELQFGGPIQEGDRGLLSEENAGPFMVSTGAFGAVTNYCTAFRYYGRVFPTSHTALIGPLTFRVETGSVRELYDSRLPAPTRNLFWSKGIQGGHLSEADFGNYGVAQEVIYESDNIVSLREKSVSISDSEVSGAAEIYYTFSRRGAWLTDQMERMTNNGTQNITPDQDFRADLWSRDYMVCTSTGAALPLTIEAPQQFQDQIIDATWPKGAQLITSSDGIKMQWTQVFNDILNLSTVENSISSKLVGDGDPFSCAHSVNGNATLRNTLYNIARCYLVRTGEDLTLDSDVLTGFRDDIATPATITFYTGTLKTDATGDADVDGFNELHGWYEVNCTPQGLRIDFLKGDPVLRFYPIFRLHSYSLVSPKVSIDGDIGVDGVDYVLDDFEDGTAILQILSDITEDTSVVVTETPILQTAGVQLWF
jgi:hypothetical protein